MIEAVRPSVHMSHLRVPFKSKHGNASCLLLYSKISYTLVGVRITEATAASELRIWHDAYRLEP